MIARRSLLKAIPALLCAPAIVKASSLMKIAPARGMRPLAYNWYSTIYEGHDISSLYSNKVMRQWVGIKAMRKVPPFHSQPVAKIAGRSNEEYARVAQRAWHTAGWPEVWVRASEDGGFASNLVNGLPSQAFVERNKISA